MHLLHFTCSIPEHPSIFWYNLFPQTGQNLQPKIMDSLSAFDDLYTAIEACLIYPDEVIDRLARAFYPAILACWNSEEGQREFAAWQAEQVHLAGKEKQEVPAGELPAVHIILVCGFWQGTSGWAHPVFLFLINKMEQIGQYDHSNNYSKKKHGQSISGL